MASMFALLAECRCPTPMKHICGDWSPRYFVQPASGRSPARVNL